MKDVNRFKRKTHVKNNLTWLDKGPLGNNKPKNSQNKYGGCV